MEDNHVGRQKSKEQNLSTEKSEQVLLAHIAMAVDGSNPSIVLQIMSANLYPVRLLGYAYIALLALIFHNRDTVIEIVRLGGIKIVIEAMKEHPHRLDLWDSGMEVLNDLIYDNETRTQIVQQGGLRVIYQGMSYFVELSCMTKLCRLLGELAYENASNAKKIITFGGIDFIHKAMKMHLNDLKAVSFGCRAIMNVVLYSDTQSMTTIKGTVNVIVSAMHAHKNNGPFMALTNLALKNLALHANKVR
jgi:hypothetical protein